MEWADEKHMSRLFQSPSFHAETHRQRRDDKQEDGRPPLDQAPRCFGVDSREIVDASDGEEDSSAGETATADRVKLGGFFTEPFESTDGL